jgi:hypothetical protein
VSCRRLLFGTEFNAVWYRPIDAKLKDVVTPQDFGAVGNGTADDTTALVNAIQFALANGRLLYGIGSYRITSPVSFRRVGVNFSRATIRVDHGGVGVFIGGNASAGNNPTQYFNEIRRQSGTSTFDTPTVRAMGVKGQHVTVHLTDYFQVYADTDPSTPGGRDQNYSCAYSTFVLKFISTIELAGNPNSTGNRIQWINENFFFLNRSSRLLINGTYDHNNNIFFGGTFEGNAEIRMDVGRSNHMRGVRLEGSPSIYFGPDVTDCTVENSWSSSNHRYPTGGISVVNEGKACSYLSVYNYMYPVRPVTAFSNETLQFDGTKYNVQRVSNISISPTSLSVGSFTQFFQTGLIPVRGDQEDTIFYCRISGGVTGGIRIRVDGFDEDGNALVPAGGDWQADGVGGREFGQVDASVNNSSGRNFFIRRNEARFVRITVNSGGTATSFKAFVLEMRKTSEGAMRDAAPYITQLTNII